MYGTIYVITNSVNGKHYVGQTTQSLEKRWGFHVGSAKFAKWAISKAIKKHGKNCFLIESLGSTASSQIELDGLERIWISLMGSMAKDGEGYNLTYGGNGAGTRTEEANRKLSETMKVTMLGNQNSRGVKLTPERILAMRAGRKYKHTPWNKGLTKHDDPRLMEASLRATIQLTGHVVKPETIAKRALKTIGQKRSAVSEFMKGNTYAAANKGGKRPDRTAYWAKFREEKEAQKAAEAQ